MRESKGLRRLRLVRMLGEAGTVASLTYDEETMRFYAVEAPIYAASGPQGARAK